MQYNVLKKRSQSIKLQEKSIELEAEGNVLHSMGLLKIWVTLLMTPCANFWGRKWNLLDIVTAGMFLSVHVLCLFAPFYFTWTAFWVALVLAYVTGFGVTLSYHRNLAHRSFRLPKLLEYSFAYCGVLSVQVRMSKHLIAISTFFNFVIFLFFLLSISVLGTIFTRICIRLMRKSCV